ncbi:MAG TPA: hypothetical protein VFA70_13900, partial [Dehalococcoidia bacterium]|nr:hypothetical protein [Dehalococcoidia bacterium]
GPSLDGGLGLPAPVAAVAGSGAGVAVAALGAVVAACLLWRLRPQLAADPAVAAGLGITLSALLAPHIFAYDLVLAAVPLAVIGMRRPGLAIGLALLLDAAHAADGYFIATGMHAETVVLLAIAAALAVAAPWRVPLSRAAAAVR